MHVVGTAGHVDHGKSTLIAALTGIHPDRLKEEQEREMTIDLGFAWMTMPDGEQIGIVDVPGHRDFIENMLAGISGIDAALFVVAADEGVMPQTREHLAILDLLQIAGGVIVLSKIDLIDDPEWLEMVVSDVRQTVQKTVLADAPIVAVSARTGAGLDELKQALSRVLKGSPQRLNLGRPRLPIDRVVSLPGFGTIVTGTLTDGQFQVGEEVEILPARIHGRIRGLQTHRIKEQVAGPGSRTAINVTGVSVDEIQRGNVVAHPGSYAPTGRLDVWFKLLPDAAGALLHNQEVKLFIGAAEIQVRLRLLGSEGLDPGQEGWLQLELRKPTIAARGDHYILRRPSPGETLGGGQVVDPHPAGRHKRFSKEVLQHLETLHNGSAEDVILRIAMATELSSLKDIVNQAQLEPGAAEEGIQSLLSSGNLVRLDDISPEPQSEDLVATLPGWQNLVRRSVAEIQAYHIAHPLRRGMPREELKSRLGLHPRAFLSGLRKMARDGQMVEDGTEIRLPGFEVQLSRPQQALVSALIEQFERSPFAPPSVKECQAMVGEELYSVLVDKGNLIQVSTEVVFRKKDYDSLVAAVRKHLEIEKTLTVIQFRDRFNTSRKYALALLEHLDAMGITRREGDFRRLTA